jgi:hypothetical protein
MLKTTSILFAALVTAFAISLGTDAASAANSTRIAPVAMAIEGPMPCPGGTDTIIDATETLRQVAQDCNAGMSSLPTIGYRV